MQQSSPLEWSIFGAAFLALLGIDIFVHRGERGESHKQAILWSVIWIAAGLGFGLYVWGRLGGQAAQEYLAAYLIEKSLSLDNLFVFLIIFRSLEIPKEYQRTALAWGVFGALVFRGIFIFLGAAALERWQWVEYAFAAILLYTAYHALRENPAEEKENRAVRWLSRHLPVTETGEHAKFLVRQGGRWMATPLLIAVLGLELTDIMFAVDSVPAAFSVTHNRFIIYSSNVFAILGLRALYIVLAKTIADLKYLHYGLAAVLAFAGVKLITPEWLEIPPLVSVGVIVLCIGVAVWASVQGRTAKGAEQAARAGKALGQKGL